MPMKPTGGNEYRAWRGPQNSAGAMRANSRPARHRSKPLSTRTHTFLARLRFAKVSTREQAEALKDMVRADDGKPIDVLTDEIGARGSDAIKTITKGHPFPNTVQLNRLLLISFFSKNTERRGWAFIKIGEVGEAWREAAFPGVKKDGWRHIPENRLTKQLLQCRVELENLLHDVREISLQLSPDKSVDSNARMAFARIKGAPLDAFRDHFV